MIIRRGTPDATQDFAIILNVQAIDRDLSGLRIAVNHHEIRLDDPANWMVFLTQNTTPAYYRSRYERSHGSRDAESMPQWVALPFPREWINQGDNEVTAWLEESGQPLPRVRVFGGVSRRYDGKLSVPSLLWTSVGRYEYDGEARVSSVLTLDSLARYSLYSEDDGESYTTDPQSEVDGLGGTYDIFLGRLGPIVDFDTLQDRSEILETPEYSHLKATLTLMTSDSQDSLSDSATDSFWLYASAPRAVRVALVDGLDPIISFIPGQSSPDRWNSDRAEMAYSPSVQTGSATTLLNAGADAIITYAPTNVATRQWYELRSTTLQRPPFAGAADHFSGAYVVHLKRPTVMRDLRFVVMPPVLLTSWEGLLGQPFVDSSRTAIPPPAAVIRIETSDTGVQYLAGVDLMRITQQMRPSVEEETGPRYFMMHGGDLSPDASVQQAASMLGLEVPSVRLLPAGASNQIVDLTPFGTLVSAWTFADPRGSAAPRAYVSMSLE